VLPGVECKSEICHTAMILARHGELRGWVVALALVAGCALLGACDDHGPGLASHHAALPARAIEGATTFGSGGDGPGRFLTPRGLVSDGNTLWVVDRTARVQQIDAATGECLQWFRMPEWELGKPTGLTIGPAPGDRPGERALYLADTHYHRVMIYALPPTPAPGVRATRASPITPTLIARLGDYGDAPGQFVYPCAVAVLPTADGRGVERIYVGEFGGNDRVQIFDRELKCIGSFGTIGDGTSPDPTRVELSRPQALAIHAARRSLFVADSINQRLGEFTLDGKLKKWIGVAGVEGSGPGQFRHPRSILVMPDSSLMVVEFGNNRVQRIDPETGRSLGVWGKAGGRVGELAEPWSIALVGKRAYVAEARTHRITSFEPN